MDDLFLATVQAVEESIVNALIAATTMTGVNGTTVEAIDHKELLRVLKQQKRLGSAAK
jgi:D-aminopeptidase